MPRRAENATPGDYTLSALSHILLCCSLCSAHAVGFLATLSHTLCSLSYAVLSLPVGFVEAVAKHRDGVNFHLSFNGGTEP